MQSIVIIHSHAAFEKIKLTVFKFMAAGIFFWSQHHIAQQHLAKQLITLLCIQKPCTQASKEKGGSMGTGISSVRDTDQHRLHSQLAILMSGTR